MISKAFLIVLVLAYAPIFSNQTIIDLPANSWYSVPNTHLQDVTPAYGEFAGTWGIVGPASVIIAWGGAAYDTKRDRLILWGGGHADYYGNELYAFDVNTLTWERLTDPFVNPVMNQEVNADGTPNSRHTYGGLAYITHADRFFGLGGSLAGSGFASCYRTWTYNFDSDQWTNRNPSVTPTVGYDCYCGYDPESSILYWQGGGSWGGLWTYNYDSNTWAKHNDDNFPSLANAIDTKRGLMFCIGNGGQATGGVCVYDIRNENYTRDTWTTTGGDAFVNKGASGLAYDPVSDRIVGWKGGAVYALNPDTREWTSYNPSGAPTATSQGMYGRWRYVPSVNAFITVTAWNDNVHFFKLTAGGGNGTFSYYREHGENRIISLAPNPVTGRTVIQIKGAIAIAAPVVKICDLRGRGIQSFTVGNRKSTDHRFIWNSAGLPSGVYLIRAGIHGKIYEKRAIILR